MGLRKNVIRLATQKPELRKHLVPILRKTAYSYSRLMKSFADMMPGAPDSEADKVFSDIMEQWTKLFLQWVQKNTKLIRLADMNFSGTITEEGSTRTETRTRDPQQARQIEVDYEVRAPKKVKGVFEIAIPVGELEDLLLDAIQKTEWDDNADDILEKILKKRTFWEDMIGSMAENSGGNYDFLEDDRKLQERIRDLTQSDAVEVEFNDIDYWDEEADYELRIQGVTIEMANDDPVIQGNKVIFSFDVEATFKIVM